MKGPALFLGKIKARSIVSENMLKTAETRAQLKQS